MLTGLSAALYRMADYHGALDVVDQAVGMEKETKTETAQTWFQKALIHYTLGEYEDAKVFVENALIRDPKLDEGLKLKLMCEDKVAKMLGHGKGGNDLEVFLVYRDGRLIHHSKGTQESTVDDMVLSSMLTAIQNFVKDSFRFQDEENIGRLEIGELKIIIEHWRLIYLAAIFRGKEPPSLKDRMREANIAIYDQFYDKLKNWNGDIESLAAVREYVEKLREIPEDDEDDDRDQLSKIDD